MKIENKTIIFKSTFANYYKERIGLKPNTCRLLNNSERGIIKKATPNKIKIENVKYGKSFVRNIADITFFNSKHFEKGYTLAIFSWDDIYD